MLDELQRSAVSRIYGNLKDDAKRALCLGDVDLEDVIDDELDSAQQQALMQRVVKWGRANGLEC